MEHRGVVPYSFSWSGERWTRGMSANNHLYYGDNLRVLREHVADESVDLIYLDPPFNERDVQCPVPVTQWRPVRRTDRGVRGHVALERPGGGRL